MLEFQVMVVERENVLACLREEAKRNWEPLFALPSSTWNWATAIYFKREVVEPAPPMVTQFL